LQGSPTLLTCFFAETLPQRTPLRRPPSGQNVHARSWRGTAGGNARVCAGLALPNPSAPPLSPSPVGWIVGWIALSGSSVVNPDDTGGMLVNSRPQSVVGGAWQRYRSPSPLFFVLITRPDCIAPQSTGDPGARPL